MAETMKLNIDLGLRSYEVCDADGNTVGVIRFNPSDAGLVSRWGDVEKQLREIIKDQDGYDTIEKIGELDEKIRGLIDFAFGTKVSEVFFKNVSSLAMCEDGELVLEKMLAAIEPIIVDAQDAAQKKSEARIEKHAGKYDGTNKGLAPSQK